MAYESETYEFICSEVKRVTGISPIKGNPTFGRLTLTPPVVAIEMGTVDLAPMQRICTTMTVQRWNLIVFGRNEPEKVKMVGQLKDWISKGAAATPEAGPRISLKLATGEPHTPLTDAQQEQYGYLFVIESH